MPFTIGSCVSRSLCLCYLPHCLVIHILHRSYILTLVLNSAIGSDIDLVFHVSTCIEMGSPTYLTVHEHFSLWSFQHSIIASTYVTGKCAFIAIIRQRLATFSGISIKNVEPFHPQFVTFKVLSRAKGKRRVRQDSNLRGQSPTDFESVPLTAPAQTLTAWTQPRRTERRKINYM